MHCFDGKDCKKTALPTRTPPDHSMTLSVFLPCSLLWVCTTLKWTHLATPVLTQVFRAEVCSAAVSHVVQLSNIKSQYQESKLDFPLTSSKQLQNGVLGVARPCLSEGGLQVCPGISLIQS